MKYSSCVSAHLVSRMGAGNILLRSKPPGCRQAAPHCNSDVGESAPAADVEDGARLFTDMPRDVARGRGSQGR